MAGVRIKTGGQADHDGRESEKQGENNEGGTAFVVMVE